MELTAEFMVEFLNKYGYEEATESGCQTILDTWMKNKAKLLERFRKHPNWDEENLAIVFKEDEYERGFDRSAFSPFRDWMLDNLDEIAKKNASPSETSNTTSYYTNGHTYFIDIQLYDKIRNVIRVMDYIQCNCNSQFITEEQARIINNYCPEVKVSEGLKLTKAIQRVCKIMELDKIKDIRPAHDNTDRMKDFGFNYQFQLLADSINPTKFKRITVISLNPLDYWGMSFGYNWTSCHTIDKSNVRGIKNHHFNGEWSSGTTSYMLDESTVIFYIIDEKYEGNTYWDENKMQRAVFSVNENGSMIYEGRVYPDGRDGGDYSLAQQFRASMQKVIAETFDLNNYWRVEKGTSTCFDNIISNGTQYADYFNYSDVNISFNKDACLEFPKIKIGRNPICPGCGCSHDYRENIVCCDCSGESDYRCDHCGEGVDEYDAIFIGDYTYCCAECAEADGYYWCEDDDEWHYEDDLYYCENDDRYHLYENVYEDDYDGCCYYGDPEVETEDGHKYASEYNAEQDGYHLDYFSDEWMSEDNLEYDEYAGKWFDPENDDAIHTTDGKVFLNENSAEDAGYVEAWVKESEVVA